MPLTKEGVTRVLGPIDDATAAELVATGAGEAELREARAWLTGDDVLVDEQRTMPSGRVAELIEILHLLERPADDEP